MGIEENKQVVARFWQAFSVGDQETTLALLDDDDFSWWILGDKSVFPIAGSMNKAQFAALLSNVSANAPNGLTMTPKAWTAEGDRVALEAESYGVMANGKLYNNHYHFLHIVRNGKLCAVKEYLDTIHANAVLCNP